MRTIRRLHNTSFVDHLQCADFKIGTEKRPNLKWLVRLDGLVRVPIFDPSDSYSGYVVVYVEKRRSYEVVAFQKENGRILWKSNLINGGYGAPALRGNELLLLSGFTDLEALDKKTGQSLWKFKTNGRIRSPINIIDNLAIVSNAGNIYAIGENGGLVFQIMSPRTFFFGLCAKNANGDFLTLGTQQGEGNKEARIYLYSFKENINWKVDLGPGNLTSSDTSGVQISNDIAYIASSERVWAIDSAGTVLWSTHSCGIGMRSLCIVSYESIFLTTVEGFVQCFDKKTGAQLWTTFLSDAGVWMPVSVFADALFVSAGGFLWMLHAKDGVIKSKMPIGQSPYSACSISEGNLFVGAGDPPYFGFLLSFEMISVDCPIASAKIIGHIKQEPKADEPVELIVFVQNAEPTKIKSISLDLSQIGDSASMPPYLSDSDKNEYRFLSDPSLGRRCGVYALPLTICYKDDKRQIIMLELEFTSRREIMDEIILNNIEMTPQENLNYSGASCIQALRRIYGEELEQSEIRDMANNVLKKSGYQAFDTWRSVARRLLLSEAKRTRDLPEFKISKEGDA